jgi:hypothetical protein
MIGFVAGAVAVATVVLLTISGVASGARGAAPIVSYDDAPANVDAAAPVAPHVVTLPAT